MKLFRVFLAVIAFAVLCATFAGTARADIQDKKTILTFSHPVEVPGKVILPAGKYIFKLIEGNSYRNLVQIWNADGTKLITNVLAISVTRQTATEGALIEFQERAGNAPQAVRTWYYHGEKTGREFVYPKARAEELAKLNNVVVPAETVEATPSELATVALVAITPQDTEEPVEAIELTSAAPVQVAENLTTATELPHTASSTPLLALLGVAFIATAVGVKRLGRQDA